MASLDPIRINFYCGWMALTLTKIIGTNTPRTNSMSMIENYRNYPIIRLYSPQFD